METASVQRRSSAARRRMALGTPAGGQGEGGEPGTAVGQGRGGDQRVTSCEAQAWAKGAWRVLSRWHGMCVWRVICA